MLLDIREWLTPAENQTHRRYSFTVPRDCTELHFRIRYAPELAPARVPDVLTISLDDAERTIAVRAIATPMISDWYLGSRPPHRAASPARYLRAGGC